MICLSVLLSLLLMLEGLAMPGRCSQELSIIESDSEYSNSSELNITQAKHLRCPPWTVTTKDNQCVCHPQIGVPDFLKCVQTPTYISSAFLPFCYCMSYNKRFNKTVVGYCVVKCYIPPHDHSRGAFHSRYEILRRTDNMSEFNDDMCIDLHMHRTGQMCGSCVKGYAPPVYSYSLACVECSDYKYNWLKYIGVAYLPLTVFYVLVITFRISAASGAMNGFILTSQIMSSSALLNYYGIFVDKYNETSNTAYYKVFTTYYGVWNLDFFRVIYTPFCIRPNMTAIQIRALDYVVAVYPLLLILITYICVSLHFRYSVVVRLWKPFYRCLMCLRKEWNIKNSLIGAFVTFILLSYVKILNISLELLTPVTLYDMQGVPLKQLYLNIDATVEYFGEEHLPFALLAIVMVLIFNILPLLLLCLFPCRCFQRCLNHFQIQREALREFMVIFHGEFQDEPRDYRYFAAFYLLLRILNLLAFFSANGVVMYFPQAITLFAVSALLIAVFKPYKRSFHNHVDTVLIFLTAMVFLMPAVSALMTSMGIHKYLGVYEIIAIVAISIHPLYGVGLLIYIFIPVQKFKRVLLAIHTYSQTYKRSRDTCTTNTQAPESPDEPPSNNDWLDEVIICGLARNA